MQKGNIGVKKKNFSLIIKNSCLRNNEIFLVSLFSMAVMLPKR